MSSQAGYVYEWRGPFTNEEVNALHAEAFEARAFDGSKWNWVELAARHSLGWVTSRSNGDLVGFVNVIWDGLVHAWIQDLMVAMTARRQGVGVGLVKAARDKARDADCEWLHVDFDDDPAASTTTPLASSRAMPGRCPCSKRKFMKRKVVRPYEGGIDGRQHSLHSQGRE